MDNISYNLGHFGIVWIQIMIMKIFKSRYHLSLNVPLIFLMYNANNIQIYTNTNNEDYTNSDTKYSEQSHKRYELFLFIRDNQKIDDKESSDVTINSTIAGCDTKSITIITIARFMYKISVIHRLWYIVKQNVSKQRHAGCLLLFQDGFDIVVCLIEYLHCLQKKILAHATNLITDFAFFAQACTHITYRTFITKV